MAIENKNTEKIVALKKGRMTDKLIDGDFSIDIGFFDNQGRYDTAQFIRYIVGFYSLVLFCISICYLVYMDYKYNHNLFSKFEDIKAFLDLAFQWWYINTKSLVNLSNTNMRMDYKIILIVSTIIALIFSYYLIKIQRFKGEIQSFLSSNNLSQYYLKRYDKKERKAVFKLIKGQPTNYKGFVDNADNFKQMFQVGKLKASRQLKTGVELQFLEETPRLIVKYKGKEYTIQQQEEMVADGIQKDHFSVKSTCKRIDFSSELRGSNKSMLGVKDINGKPLFCAFPQTVGMIQGHTLIGGGTGSGKSFMTTNWIKSALMGDTAQFLDEIICINMKEDSPDWEFLRGYKKASLYTGLEEALVALKKAELKMLANNRWNTLNGKDNTTYGQTIVIIDEIHKFQLIVNDRTQPQTVKLVAGKCNTIIDTLATQSRSSNVFLICILQKATLDQLSGTFRSNAMNRILLRSDKISSGVIIDEEVQEENMIDSQKLTSGQFIYYNLQNGLINEGFAVEAVKWDLDKANNLEENSILIEGRKQSLKLIEQAKIVAQLKAEKAEQDREDKDFANKVNDYSLLEQDTRDYWNEAQKIFLGENKSIGEDKEIKSNIEKLMKKTSKNVENFMKPIIEIKTPKRKEASEEEIDKFLQANDKVVEIEKKLEDFNDIEEEAYKKIEELTEIEENTKEALKDKLEPNEIKAIELELIKAKKEITINI